MQRLADDITEHLLLTVLESKKVLNGEDGLPVLHSTGLIILLTQIQFICTSEYIYLKYLFKIFI